ncbi:MAG: hypothetical protein K6G15_11265 [Desulfovibrio sp.]|nr:hypothetical protein [Desulfovibrio sp.]
METCDVALNIFAKPYQTALAILSLLANCQNQIGTIWLQFEPAGSRFDSTSPYAIAYYLNEVIKFPCVVFQPKDWFDCAVAEPSRLLRDEAYRLGLRFEYAMEHSQSRLLFLMHNDVLILKNLLTPMMAEMGEAFAIGPLGQCWNCPASSASLMQTSLQRPACRPEAYAKTQLSYAELCQLYKASDAVGQFKRSYSDGLATLGDQPWPLPECRINEWACLLDLKKTRPLTMPEGAALPLGAYAQCGSHTLDIGVAWFRAMHAHGLHAKHFATAGWLEHWVGTGHKSRLRYTQAEEHAKALLQRFFPHYLLWLNKQSQFSNLPVR